MIVVKIKDNGLVKEFKETPSKFIKYRESMMSGNEEENKGKAKDKSVVIYRGVKIPFSGTNMVMDPLLLKKGASNGTEFGTEGSKYAEIESEEPQYKRENSAVLIS